MAGAGSKGPTSETVSDVRSVASSAAQAVVEVGVISRSAVVQTRSGIVGLATLVANLALSLGQELLKARALRCASNTVVDHEADGG